MKVKTSLLGTMLFAATLIFFTGCKKDEPVPPAGNSTPVMPGDGVFVTCEGNFQGGNAKVSFFRYSDASVTEDLFLPANARPLGDVCQGMEFFGGRAYVVVNNSGKIEVVNPVNFFSTGTITGFTSPRFILPVSSTKAYVTDLFSGSISVVSLSSNTITGSIALAGWTETMTMVGTEVFVTAPSSDKIYIINSANDQITDSIAIAKGGNSAQLDMNGKLWVLCYGDYFTSTPGGLYRIDPATHMVEQSWPFTTAESPTRLCANASRDTLYYLNYSVYRMPITAVALPATPFIAATTQSFYGLAVHPQTDEVWVTDAVNFNQRGYLLRYSTAGVQQASVQVGVNPSGIYFY